MVNKPIFYDADVLICFLAINRCEILKKLFSKIIIPSPVYYELIRIEKYENLKDELNSLINEGFVEIQEFDFASPEETNFNLIHRGYWTMVILLVGENPLQWHLQLKIRELLQAII